MIRLTLFLTLAALTLGAASPSVAPPDALGARLRDARATYERMLATNPQAATLLAGLHLDDRLKDDTDLLAMERPQDITAAIWDQSLFDEIALDTNLVDQLVAAPALFALETGLREHIIRSATDGALDAVATYVPAIAPRAVAIVLHGNPQTEAQLIGPQYLRALADETGTILVAPYGRGSYDFKGTPTLDFYGLLVMLKARPELAKLPFYLVGYSMGGFTAYMIGPQAPVAWSGVLDISGALVGSASGAVLKYWRHTRIYVVHGGNDTSIPTRFSRDTAIFLYNSGIDVSYYEQGGSGHYLRELIPTVRIAWNDMLKGVVRDGPAAELARDNQPMLPGAMGGPASKMEQP